MRFHEIDNAQKQFLINTYNEVQGIPVWHIHGEARKPDSMIIGNYFYSKLLRRCVERLDGFSGAEDGSKKKYSGTTKTNSFTALKKQNKKIKVGSWIDAFVLGDVYMLGFGLDLSESDIWWLIEYKANHPDICGKTYYYEPHKDTMAVCVNDEMIPCEKRAGFASTVMKFLIMDGAAFPGTPFTVPSSRIPR